MKSYPSIETEIRDGEYYVFDKLDGSNIRAEWSRKHKGFTKFGSRNVLLDETNQILGPAIPLIKAKYEKVLTEIFISERFEKATCFFEFFGPNSFAGNHEPQDEKNVVLFDIDVFKQGILDPKEFLDLFKDTGVDHAKLLYHGNLTKDFIESVRNGTLEGMTFEGVICKARRQKKFNAPDMIKIKSTSWLEKLKDKYKDDIGMFERLK